MDLIILEVVLEVSEESVCGIYIWNAGGIALKRVKANGPMRNEKVFILNVVIGGEKVVLSLLFIESINK